MNTPAHLALSLAVMGRASRRGDWWWIGLGAVLPDALLFVDALTRTTAPFLRDTLAGLVPVFESAPIYALFAALAWLSGRRGALLVALSALLHIAMDLPLHAADARAHFWPLSGAVFHSPVSFWDSAHHGRIAGLVEGVLFVACFSVIWRRLTRTWHRALALVLAAVYAATFVHFLGHAYARAHWAVW